MADIAILPPPRIAQALILSLVCSMALLEACSRVDTRYFDTMSIKSTLEQAKGAIAACDGKRVTELISPSDRSSMNEDAVLKNTEQFQKACQANGPDMQEAKVKIVMAQGMTPKYGADGVSAEFDLTELGKWHYGSPQLRFVKYDGQRYLRE